MQRSMCGLAVLAALTSLWSCNGDPTESIRGGERLIAEPTSILIEQGTTQFVTVRAVDNQGNALEAPVTVENVGAGITVVEDPTYLTTTINTRLGTSSRFVVGATGPATTSFLLRSGSDTLTIPVRVIPTLPGTTDPATAPVLALPPVGQSNNHFDIPALATNPFAYYQIVVPADVPAVTITLHWQGDETDIDLFVCPPPVPADFGTCDFAAATGAHPESHTYALAPGTYVLVVNLFAGAAPPNLFWEFTSETAAPAP
jgi:hypothetical protein